MQSKEVFTNCRKSEYLLSTPKSYYISREFPAHFFLSQSTYLTSFLTLHVARPTPYLTDQTKPLDIIIPYKKIYPLMVNLKISII